MYAPIAGQSSDGVDVALDSEANRRLGGGIRCRQQQRSLCDWSSPGLLHHQVRLGRGEVFNHDTVERGGGHDSGGRVEAGG